VAEDLSDDKENKLLRRRLDPSRLRFSLAPLLALWALLFRMWWPGAQLPSIPTLPGGSLPGVTLPTLPGVTTLPTLPSGTGTVPPPGTGTGGGTGTPGPVTTGPLSGKYFSGNFTNAAGTRAYSGYVPSTYHAGTAVPLIVALHGCTQSADVFRQQTQLDALAESKNFIVIFPEQPSSANQLECWNWFQASDMQRSQGEPTIIAGITQWVQQNYTVDSKRIYVEGFSAGGAMAAVMGATYPDLYSAIGVGSGIEYNGGTAALGGAQLNATQAGQDAYAAMGGYARIVPALVFHGVKDKTVPVSNATDLVHQWLTTDDLADDGAVNGSIPAGPASTQSLVSPGGQSYTVSSYNDGHGKQIVESILVDNMEHAWSGGCSCESYTFPSGPNESQAMYDFFMNHPKP